MTSDRYAVRIETLDAEGPELPDEVLRATRGGWYNVQNMSTCEMGGQVDGDGPVDFSF